MTELSYKNYKIVIDRGEVRISPPNRGIKKKLDEVLVDTYVPAYTQNIDNDLARGLIKKIKGIEIVSLGIERDWEGMAFENPKLLLEI